MYSDRGLFMVYKIIEICINCGACVSECPVSCISPGEYIYEIDEEICIGCGACAAVCPTDACIEA